MLNHSQKGAQSNMNKQYPIQWLDEEGLTFYYPAELKGVKQTDMQIAYGTFSVTAKCLPHPEGRNRIILTKELAKQLKIPKLAGPLHLFINEKTLYLGPLIGIFTSGFTPFKVRPLGERTLFFSKLLSVKKTIGAHAFIFGENHINWEDGTINGLFYQEKGWETIEVPFPNVIYDRLPNRRSEKRVRLAQVKDRLQNDYLIPWYNPGFFNKLEIFEKLQQDQKCEKYLPETHPFTSFSLIERMLADYGHVYLKPKNGSLGNGIHQIIYNAVEGHYYCRYQDKQGDNKLRKYQTLESLFSNLFKNKRLTGMLVQQGIHSLRVDKRPVDFRVHTNKDALGNWKVTAIAAKIAGLGSVTTHVKNGGEIKTIPEIFESAAQQEEIIAKLKTACLELSSCLENQMNGIIGEIGFDLGIDREGNVWLFEANSKPGRSIFKHPQLKEYDMLTRKLSLAFSIFLTEQSISRPEEIFK